MRFTKFDFGITWLASNFHADWRIIGGPVEVLDSTIWDELDPRAVELVRRDAELMLGMPTARDVEILWNMATEGGSPFGAEIASGFSWMELIVAKCESWMASKPVPGLGEADECYGAELADAVSVEIPQVWPQDSETAFALVSCLDHCTPDLAFRFLLRGMVSNLIDTEVNQYRRFRRLGGKLHYGEFLVSETEFLVT